MRILEEIAIGIAKTADNLTKAAESQELENRIGLDLCMELEKISRENIRLAKEMRELAQLYGA